MCICFGGMGVIGNILEKKTNKSNNHNKLTITTNYHTITSNVRRDNNNDDNRRDILNGSIRREIDDRTLVT
jgi:hypothetical protein